MVYGSDGLAAVFDFVGFVLFCGWRVVALAVELKFKEKVKNSTMRGKIINCSIILFLFSLITGCSSSTSN